MDISARTFLHISVLILWLIRFLLGDLVKKKTSWVVKNFLCPRIEQEVGCLEVKGQGHKNRNIRTRKLNICLCLLKPDNNNVLIGTLCITISYSRYVLCLLSVFNAKIVRDSCWLTNTVLWIMAVSFACCKSQWRFGISISDQIKSSINTVVF